MNLSTGPWITALILFASFDALNDSRNLESAIKAGKDTSPFMSRVRWFIQSVLFTPLESFTKGA